MTNFPLMGWLKVLIGAASAAAGAGLIHPDPQIVSFLLALYAALSGGTAIANGNKS